MVFKKHKNIKQNCNAFNEALTQKWNEITNDLSLYVCIFKGHIPKQQRFAGGKITGDFIFLFKLFYSFKFCTKNMHYNEIRKTNVIFKNHTYI